MKRKAILAMVDERIRGIIANTDEMTILDVHQYAGNIKTNMCILDELRDLRDEIKDTKQ